MSKYNLPNQTPEYYKLLEAYEDALNEAKYWERNYKRAIKHEEELMKKITAAAVDRQEEG